MMLFSTKLLPARRGAGLLRLRAGATPMHPPADQALRSTPAIKALMNKLARQTRSTAAPSPALLGALVLVLAACSEAPPTPSAQDLARAESLRPADAVLAEKYERSCLTCHSQPASQSPLTGFAPAWKPRLKQGMDVLLTHAEQGLNAMPAKGLCADCSRDELRELIVFMSQAAP